MSLKVVSGTIWTTEHQRGSARIDWVSRRMTGDTRKQSLRVIGTRGRFKKTPIVTVSLRAIRVVSGGSGDIDDFNIDTRKITRDGAEIFWEATGASRVQEISFLAIGESELTA